MFEQPIIMNRLKRCVCLPCLLTRLLKHITGQKEQPNVQQQQMHPQKSHLMLLRQSHGEKKKQEEKKQQHKH